MALEMSKDVTCVAATGFGKSLAFQIAAMLLEGKFGCLVEGGVDRNSGRYFKGNMIWVRIYMTAGKL